MKRRNKILIVIILLCLHTCFLVTSALQHSPTFDEIAHLTAGYSHLRTGDFRLNPEHPPLVFLWCSLPLLFQKSTFPSLNSKAWQLSDAWNFGREFFYDCGNDPQRLLFWARFMVMLLSMGMGLLVFSIARHLFGDKGALFSLLLYAFSPTILAHGNLVTTDLALSSFLLASVYGFWKVLHHFSIKNILLSTLAFSGLFTSKFSAVLFIPIAILMIFVKLTKGPPLRIGKKQKIVRSLRIEISYLCFLLLFQILVVFCSIWIIYGFRFSPFKANPVENARYFTITSLSEGETPWEHQLKDQGLSGQCIKALRDRKILPDAYLYGFLFMLNYSKKRSAFLNGEMRTKGWWYYFPYAFLVKTPLPLLGILIITIYFSLSSRKPFPSEDRNNQNKPDDKIKIRYETIPLWILFIVYWVAALTTRLNIGHRHILPLYPVIFIFAGSFVCRWYDTKPAIRWIASVVVVLFLVSSLHIRPHYLSYFNLIAGGPRNGYRHLVDSNLDWGQDLPALKKYLDKDHQSIAYPITYLAYFGTGNHHMYDIKAKLLPCVPPRAIESYSDLSGGRYCISATLLHQVYLLPYCRWTESMEKTYQESLLLVSKFLKDSKGKGIQHPLIEEAGFAFWNEFFDLYYKLRLGRLCARLRKKEPDAYAGYSILIFNLTDEEVRKALKEQPSELIQDPDFMRKDPNQKIHSPLAGFHYSKGLIFAQKGNHEDAIQELQKSLTFDPDALEVKDSLHKIMQQKKE